MSVKLLTEHLLEILSLKGGCTGSAESTLVKISNCWKSHAAAHMSVRMKLSLHVANVICSIYLFVIWLDQHPLVIRPLLHLEIQ